jgi:tetratricopeptide (TPR) repeat protein
MLKVWPTRVLISAVAAYFIFCGTVGVLVHAKAALGKSLAPLPAVTVVPPNAPPGAPATADQMRQQSADLSLQEQKLTLWQKALEDRAKDVDQRSSDLEKLISDMTIGTSFYMVLLGLFAAFSLKDARDQAAGALKDIRERAAEQTKELKEDFSEFQKQVEERIPNLIGMQKALDGILYRITQEIDLTEIWTSPEPFKKLSLEQRERILLAELTVASFDYFRVASVGSRNSKASEIFANLATFYSARGRANKNEYDQGDLQRALIYIDRACDMDTESYSHLALRAALILTCVRRDGDPVTRENLDKAAMDLNRSLEIEPNYAAALYNLAWVVDEQGNPGRAVDLLTKFINEREKLPLAFRGQRLIAAYINRACAKAKGLARDPADPQGKRLAEILEDCRAAREEGRESSETLYFTRSIESNSAEGQELHLLESLAPKDLRALLNGDCSARADPTRSAGE